MKSFWAAALLVLTVTGASAAEEPKAETFETLAVGPLIYTNVTILNKTKADLFISHTGGIANIKVKSLDKSAQLQLGYQLVDPAPTNAPAESIVALPKINIDSKYEDLAQQYRWEAQEFLAKLPPTVFYAAGGIVFVLYLFFCYCCWLICSKAGQEKLALVWFPLVKQVPLLRAAGMSPWWIVSNLLPPVFLVVFIVWSFKISKVREKHWVVGLLLLLPVVGVFAFLYLAFSAGPKQAEQKQTSGKGKVLTFNQNPRRAA